MSFIHTSQGHTIATLSANIDSVKLQQLLAQPYMTQIQSGGKQAVECRRVGTDVNLRGKSEGNNVKVQILKVEGNRSRRENEKEEKKSEVKVLRENSNLRKDKGRKEKEREKRQKKIYEISKQARDIVKTQIEKKEKKEKKSRKEGSKEIIEEFETKRETKSLEDSEARKKQDFDRKRETVMKLIEESTRQEKLRQEKLREEQQQKARQKQVKKELMQEYTEVSRKVLAKTVKKKFESKLPWGADQRNLITDEAEREKKREEREKARKIKEENKLTREQRRAQLGLDMFEDIEKIKQRSKSPVEKKKVKQRDPSLGLLVEQQRKKRKEQEIAKKLEREEKERKRLEALRKLEQEHKQHTLEAMKEKQAQKAGSASAKQKIKEAILKMIERDKEMQENKEVNSDSMSECDIYPTKDVILNIEQSGRAESQQRSSSASRAVISRQSKRASSESIQESIRAERTVRSIIEPSYEGSPIQNVSHISLENSQRSSNAEVNTRNGSSGSDRKSEREEGDYEEDYFEEEEIQQEDFDDQSHQDYEYEYERDSASYDQTPSRTQSYSQSQDQSRIQSQDQSRVRSQDQIRFQSQDQSRVQSQDQSRNESYGSKEGEYPGFRYQYEDYEILKPKEARQIRNPGIFELNYESARRGAEANLHFIKQEAKIDKDSKLKKEELRKKLGLLAEKADQPEFTHMKTDIKLNIKPDVSDDLDLKLFEIPGILNLGNHFKQGDWKAILYEKQASAATKIQKLFRGYKARKYYKSIKPCLPDADKISRDARKILAIAYPQIYTEPNLFHKPEQFKPFQEPKPARSRVPLKLQNYIKRPESDQFNIVDVLAREILDTYPKELIEIESESENYSSNFEEGTVTEESQLKSSEYEESKSETYTDSFLTDSKASYVDGRSYESSPHALYKWNSKKSIPESISESSKGIYESKKSLLDSIHTDLNSSKKFDESKSMQGSIQESIYASSKNLASKSIQESIYASSKNFNSRSIQESIYGSSKNLASKSIPESIQYDSTSRLKASKSIPESIQLESSSRTPGLTKSSEIHTEISESNRYDTSRHNYTRSGEIPTEISVSKYSSGHYRPGRKLTIPEEVESSEIHTEYSRGSSPSRLRRSRTVSDRYDEDFESISASKSPSLRHQRSSLNLRKTPSDTYESDFEAISMSSPSPNRLGGAQPVIREREKVKIVEPPRSEVIEALQEKLKKEVEALDRAQQREQKLDLLLEDHKKWLDEQKLNVLLKTLHAQEIYTKEIVKAKKQESLNFKKFTKEFMIQQKQAFDRLISVLGQQPRYPIEPVSKSPTISLYKPKPHEQIIESSAESYDEDFETDSISQSVKSLHRSHSIPESIKSIHYQESEASINESKYDEEIDESIQNESYISDSIQSYSNSPNTSSPAKPIRPPNIPTTESIRSYYDSSSNIQESIQESKDSYGISESIKVSGSNVGASIKSSYREKDSGNIKVIDESRDIDESIRTEEEISSQGSSISETDRSEISESHKVADSYNQIEESIADYKESHDIVTESDYYKDTFEKFSGSLGPKQSVDRITESMASVQESADKITESIFSIKESTDRIPESIKESTDKIAESIDAYKQSYASASQSDYYQDTFEKFSASIEPKSIEKFSESNISESIDAYKESQDNQSSVDSMHTVPKIIESIQESDHSSSSSIKEPLSSGRLNDSRSRSERFDSSLRIPDDLEEIDESIRSHYLDDSHDEISNYASPDKISKESRDSKSKSIESEESKRSLISYQSEESEYKSEYDVKSSIESQDKLEESESSNPSFKSASVESEEIVSEYESDFEEVGSETEKEVDVEDIVEELYAQLIKDAKGLIPVAKQQQGKGRSVDEQTDRITDDLWRNILNEVLSEIPTRTDLVLTDPDSVVKFADSLLDFIKNDSLKPLKMEPLSYLQEITEAPLQSVILSRFPPTQPVLASSFADDSQECIDIHNHLILDAANEALNNLRPYGILGEPVPWSSRVRSVTSHPKISSIKPAALALIKKWASIRAGKLAPIGSEYPSESPDQYTEILKSDIQAEEDLWTHYEFEETQVCLDLVSDVLEFLAEETASLLNSI